MAHPESVKRTFDKWRSNNREKYLQGSRNNYYKNREKRKQQRKEYHKRTYPDRRLQIIAKTKAYAQAHPEVRRRCYLNYKLRHPERYKARNYVLNKRRRAVVRGAGRSDKSADALILAWRQKPSFECFYCGRRFLIKKLHVDHKIPVTKGGEHTAKNICRACPRCNIRKRDALVNAADYKGQTLLPIEA